MHRQALELARSLSRDDPRSLPKRFDIYLLLAKLADANARREQFDQVVWSYEQIRENVRALAEAGLINEGRRAELDSLNAGLESVYRQAQRAIDEPAWIATQPPMLARSLWAVRCLALAHRGDVRAATEAAETLRKLAPADVGYLIDVARTYALCVPTASTKSAAGSAKDTLPSNECARKAIDTLKAAVKLEPNLLATGWLNPDFNSPYALPAYRSKLGRSQTAGKH